LHSNGKLVKETLRDKFKNIFTLGLTNFTSSIINSVFWIYLASILEKSDYGMLGYLISIAMISSVVASLGLPRTIIVFGARDEKILSPAYTLGLISSSVVSVAVYIITENIALSFFTWGLMIFFLRTSDLASRELYSSFNKYKLLRISLTVVLGLSLLQIFGINGIILGFALATLPSLDGLYNYVKNKKIGITVLKPKINFMVNSWLTRLSYQLFWWGDKIVIGSMFGFTLLANYQLAVQYLMLLDNIPRTLMLYLLPQESKRRKNKAVKIFAVLLSFIIVMISIVMIPWGIDKFFPAYQESIFPAQIMSVALIPITIAAILESQLVGKEITKMVLIATAIQTILYLLLIVLLGIEFGIIGIAAAFLISSLVKVAFLAIFTQLSQKTTISKN